MTGFPLPPPAFSSSFSGVGSSVSVVTSPLLGFSRSLSYPDSSLDISASSLLPLPPSPPVSLSHREPTFGHSIVLSKTQNRVCVHSGPGSNQIYQNVLTSVLNDSYIVDFETSSHGLDSFYFTKTDSW